MKNKPTTLHTRTNIELFLSLTHWHNTVSSGAKAIGLAFYPAGVANVSQFHHAVEKRMSLGSVGYYCLSAGEIILSLHFLYYCMAPKKHKNNIMMIVR